MSEPVTLDTCAREPIHIPGAIQPHGVLIACRQGTIVAISANCRSALGTSPAAVGTPVVALFDADSGARLTAAFAAPERLYEVNPMMVTAASGAQFDAVLHVAVGGEQVIELESATEPLTGFDPRLRTAVMRLQRASSLDELYRMAASEVRAVTGFDRVMVYRFDPEWNGEVVAEDRRADLEPFLGLHYPASDIPEQARRLYTINPLRFIADVGYQPVPVVPAASPPLDMSFAGLRSVSPIHIEYLRNMGVTASMSVSLLVEGALVGLIACHHYSGPRLISFRVRETSDYLGRALSSSLAALERARRSERAQRSAQRETALVRAIADSHDVLEPLASPALLELAEADGAAVVLGEGTRTVGDCPPASVLDRLVAWLSEHAHDVFATSNPSVDLPIALPQHGGVLAVAISHALREYVLWFRRPTEQVVDWAGDPRKVIVHQEAGAPPRLSPRGSFALWRETVRGRSQVWDPTTIAAASNLRRTLLSGVRTRAAELRAYNERLLDADQAKDNFIATVSHELRTPLNAIIGWAHLLGQGSPSPERVRQGIEVIDRNARAQTKIVDDLLDVSRMVSGKLTLDLTTVDFHEVVADALDSVEVGLTAKSLRLKRVLAAGPALVLGDAARLRQIIVNLLTNAMKFTPKGGAITVSLRKVDSELELAVQDTGQGITPEFLPLVFDVFRQEDSGRNRREAGLGLGLAIARKLAELHGGRITAESAGVGQGATFRLRVPLTTVRLTATPPDGVSTLPRPLVGFDILVVEDETDSRELLCLVLSEAGARCTQCASAAEALDALRSHPYTVVVSDIGMPGQDGLSFMRELRTRPPEHNGKTPAIALTAYTRPTDRAAVLDAGYDAHLGKPVDTNELLSVVRNVVARLRR